MATVASFFTIWIPIFLLLLFGKIDSRDAKDADRLMKRIVRYRRVISYLHGEKHQFSNLISYSTLVSNFGYPYCCLMQWSKLFLIDSGRTLIPVNLCTCQKDDRINESGDTVISDMTIVSRDAWRHEYCGFLKTCKLSISREGLLSSLSILSYSDLSLS